VTNSLGKQFFDAADTRRRRNPDYVRVNVSGTGAIAASTAQAGGSSMSALYLLRRLQNVRGEEGERAADDGVFGKPRADNVARQIDDLLSGAAESAPGLCGVKPYRVYDPWNELHNERRMTIRVPVRLHLLRGTRRQRDAEGIPEKPVAVFRRRHAEDRRHR
jgi:hypothetical protein